MGTPHNNAGTGDFGKTVLMPGDPLRAKFIAENFLTEAKLVNNVRGFQGYTGSYNGVRVSVMASGMGMPSIGIYSHELFHFSAWRILFGSAARGQSRRSWPCGTWYSVRQPVRIPIMRTSSGFRVILRRLQIIRFWKRQCGQPARWESNRLWGTC